MRLGVAPLRGGSFQQDWQYTPGATTWSKVAEDVHPSAVEGFGSWLIARAQSARSVAYMRVPELSFSQLMRLPASRRYWGRSSFSSSFFRAKHFLHSDSMWSLSWAIRPLYGSPFTVAA